MVDEYGIWSAHKKAQQGRKPRAPTSSVTPRSYKKRDKTAKSSVTPKPSTKREPRPVPTEIISLKEAKALGLKYFFTGKPCRHGHISERYIHGSCVECSLDYRKKYYADAKLGMSYSIRYDRLPKELSVQKPTVENKPTQRKNAHTYEGFVRPDGTPEPPIANLINFCKEHGLSAANMWSVNRGTARSAKGWTCPSSWKQKPRKKAVQKPRATKTFIGFIRPDGTPEPPIAHLPNFCREHGLNRGSMYGLYSGRTKRYKGWTYSPAAEFN